MSIRRLRPLWLLTPQLLLTGLLIFGILQGVMQSFGIIPSLGLTTWTLDYYRQALSHSQFWTSLGFSLQLAFFSSIISMGLGLLICYLLVSSQEKTLYVERLIRIPIIVPHIVVALFVLLIFSRTGLLARLLYALGFEQAQQWMGGLTYDPHGIGINLAYVWKETPFIVFFAIQA